MAVLVEHERGATYRVTLVEDGEVTTHMVKVWPSDLARYAPSATPEELLEASFEFLLERAPRSSIADRFELPTIEDRFPEYPVAMGARFL